MVIDGQDPNLDSFWKKFEPHAREALLGLAEDLPRILEFCFEPFPEESTIVAKGILDYRDWLSQYREFEIVGDFTSLLLPGGLDAFVERLRPVADSDQGAAQVAVVMKFTLRFVMLGLGQPSALLRRIECGEDEAIFDFARVDRTILNHPAVQKRIRAATLSGDKEFFRKLARSLQFDSTRFPPERLRQTYLTAIALFAREKPTINELLVALDHVFGLYDYPDTVRRAWNRLGLHTQILPSFPRCLQRNPPEVNRARTSRTVLDRVLS